MRDWQPIVGAFIIAALTVAHTTAQAQQAKTAAKSTKGPGEKFVDRKDNLTRPAAPPWFLPDEIGVRLLAGRFSSFAPIDGVEQEARTSFYPDLVLRFRLNREHALQTGIAYVQKGATLNGDADIGTANYVTIPLLYRINPQTWTPSKWIQPYATAGGYFGVLVGGSFEDFDNASQYDVGVSVGFGANVHVHPAWILDVGVQYSQGLFSVLDGSERTNRTTLFAVAATWDLGGDDDADGLLNRREKFACWTKAEDWDKWAGDDGCPDEDNDGDGLSDDIDPCPDRPEDKDGFRDWDGCPDMDDDFDLVVDDDDECSEQPFWGPLDAPSEQEILAIPEDKRGDKGCFPEYKKFDIIPGLRALQMRAGYVLDNFAKNSSKFNNSNHVQAQQGLDEIAIFLKAFPFVKLHVQGHKEAAERAGVDTDRASAAISYLEKKKGVSKNQLINDPPAACAACPTVTPVKKPGPQPVKSERLVKLEKLGSAVFRSQKLYKEFRQERNEYERQLGNWNRKNRRYKVYLAASAVAQACKQQTGPGSDRRVTFTIE